jgi:hypothetical protein
VNIRYTVSVLAVILAGAQVVPAAASTTSSIETIVLIRHGEKTAGELGQLSIRGFNRALALPNVLVGKFNKPDYLFAPDPAVDVKDKNGREFSYIRPLATIAPTAIMLGMPVNAQIGFDDAKELEAELVKPKYANAVVFIAWEHYYAYDVAKDLMAKYAHSTAAVPEWPRDDFDSIYVVRIVRSNGKTTATFHHDHEGLDGKLSDRYPGGAVK